jgi:CubicO group peptidase (beta-lactamase class C family)
VKKIILVVAGLVGIALVGIIIFAWIEFGYTGSNKSRFIGPSSIDEPLPEDLISDLERYVTKAMKQIDVPGVSMVLVQGDKVVYSRGIGVRDLQSKAPVTTETLFGIGSTTKSMTAVMIASMVDEGVIDWNTPVIEILPTFSLIDPQITKEVTIEHTLCMCTGIPRKMEDISTRYSEMTGEDIIESLASIPRIGAFEHSFNYSSRMLAAGGYIASMAAGGDYGNLEQAYANLMEERLLSPLNMTSSTFSIDEAVASGNYATPHYASMSGTNAIPPEIEGIFTPISPAGALWSNADDMAKYLIMLLNNGISLDGRQIVSSENLTYQWEPRVAIDEQFSYGLGWNIEDYQGLTVIHHPGGTVGFASELVIIPERNIGFALLANQMDQIKPVGRMATYRLLEMLTGSEQVYDQEVRQTARDIRRQVFSLSLVTRKKVDPDEIAPYLGTYHNDALGEVKLVVHEDNSLWVDFGEYESPVRRMALEENQYIFFESIFIGKTLTLSMNSKGNVSMRWSGDESVYTFTK